MINIGNAPHPLLCVCNGLLLILLALSPDKRYPAGLEMSLEWKHVPQKCVENDHAVSCSFLCDGTQCSVHLPKEREREWGEKTGQIEGISQPLRSRYCQCQGQGCSGFLGLSLCISEMF